MKMPLAPALLLGRRRAVVVLLQQCAIAQQQVEELRTAQIELGVCRSRFLGPLVT